jgi:hypothetical protein
MAPAGPTANITPFAAVLTGTRVYDALKDGDSSILSVSNAFAGDTVNVASGVGTIASKNVGNETITNFGTLTLGNNPLGDYTLVGARGTVIVTPLRLTVTAVPDTKPYDGTPTSAAMPIITTGALKGTDIGAFTESYGGKNAGIGLTLSPTGLVTDGNGGNNYIVTFAPIMTGIINPRPVILTGTRVFDSTTNALASISSITNAVTGDGVNVATGVGILINPAVGNEPIANFGTLTLGGDAAGNYTFIGGSGQVLVTATITIVPPPLNQTTSGLGTSPFVNTLYDGGILRLQARQNGIVTGTIATIDGIDQSPEGLLGCTLADTGCLQTGVAPTPDGAPKPAN